MPTNVNKGKEAYLFQILIFSDYFIYNAAPNTNELKSRSGLKFV